MTKSLLAVLAFFMVLVGMKPAVAGEVIGKKWGPPGANYLMVTYFDHDPNREGYIPMIKCWAFDSSGRELGNGFTVMPRWVSHKEIK